LNLVAFFLWLCLCVPANAAEQKRSWLEAGTLPDNPKWNFWSVLVDAGKQTLNIGTRSGGGFLKDLVVDAPDAAINGAYFLANYRPAGWLLAGGKTYGKPNVKSRGGVFYMKKGRVGIAGLKQVPSKVDLAVQNSPVLVHPGAKADTALNAVKRAWRTVVCLPAQDASGTQVRFIVIKSGMGDGPTLRETAEILAKPVKDGGFGCRQALNLDGGPSSGIIFPRHHDIAPSPPAVPVGHALLIGGF
jgi:hypothetical protein